MNIISKFSPDLSTVWSIQYFKKNQIQPAPNLLASVWLNIPAKTELPYIYHHLRKGSILKLVRPHSGKLSNKVCLYYKQFFIGELPYGINNVISEKLIEGNVLKAQISEIEKEPFIPTSGIKVELFKA